MEYRKSLKPLVDEAFKTYLRNFRQGLDSDDDNTSDSASVQERKPLSQFAFCMKELKAMYEETTKEGKEAVSTLR